MYTQAATKAAALRINLNVQGCVIVATPIHAPSRTPLLLPLLLSHNLPIPRVHECVMGRLVHTDFGSSSLVAHVIHYHPPPTRSFVIGTAVIDTHGYGKPEAQDLRPKARRMVPLSLLATARRHRPGCVAGGAGSTTLLMTYGLVGNPPPVCVSEPCGW